MHANMKVNLCSLSQTRTMPGWKKALVSIVEINTI